jgi:hypothetical protein
MEDLVRYRAFEALCRQRAKMEGESSAFWLEEAEILSRLITVEGRLRTLDQEQNRPSELGA